MTDDLVTDPRVIRALIAAGRVVNPESVCARCLAPLSRSKSTPFCVHCHQHERSIA